MARIGRRASALSRGKIKSDQDLKGIPSFIGGDLGLRIGTWILLGSSFTVSSKTEKVGSAARKISPRKNYKWLR
jgi:hypothetical protein